VVGERGDVRERQIKWISRLADTDTDTDTDTDIDTDTDSDSDSDTDKLN